VQNFNKHSSLDRTGAGVSTIIKVENILIELAPEIILKFTIVNFQHLFKLHGNDESVII
jgi:hypothetical protein